MYAGRGQIDTMAADRYNRRMYAGMAVRDDGAPAVPH